MRFESEPEMFQRVEPRNEWVLMRVISLGDGNIAMMETIGCIATWAVSITRGSVGWIFIGDDILARYALVHEDGFAAIIRDLPTE